MALVTQGLRRQLECFAGERRDSGSAFEFDYVRTNVVSAAFEIPNLFQVLANLQEP